MSNQKTYPKGKQVKVELIHTETTVTVSLYEYNRNGIVFTDPEIGGGKAGIFVPYSNIGAIIEEVG